RTVLRGGKRSGTKRVPVTLSARCTEIGTLELFCVAKEGDNRWRLEFNVRDIVSDATEEADEAGGRSITTDVFPEDLVQRAAERIRDTFPGAASPNELTRAVGAGPGASRHHWPTRLCPRPLTVLEEQADQRTRSAQRLNRWYHLAGFCLRPGFGDSLDRYRIEQLWKMLAAPFRAGGLSQQQAEGGADYWIMWRRVAGGLSTAIQNTLFNRIRPVLLPPQGKVATKPGPISQPTARP